MNINLLHNKAFKWCISENISFKGYFYVEDKFYDNTKAIKFLESTKNKDDFEKLIEKLNGVFTVIFSIEDATFIYSDITRSFPIFYTIQNNEFFISDDIYYLKLKFEIDAFDLLSEIEFKAANHTFGAKTLLKEVYQIQASQLLEIKNNSIIRSAFKFSYAIEKEGKSNFKNLKKKAINTFEDSFKRFTISLQNRTAVVPLSGGFDSRLIVTMLKKYNVENVICYTYGRKTSFEIENSKKVAENLGYKWIFITYDEALFDNYLQSSDFKRYIEFAGKLSSMPNLQEYFAVKYLKENSIVPDDSIFIPGYAGDLLGGSQYGKTIPQKLKSYEIVHLISRQKLTNYPIEKTVVDVLKTGFKGTLQKYDENYQDKIPSSVFEDFDIKEKIAKYIFNSASFYTYFGYEFRFPFWDKALLDFFKEVPIKYKYNKILFDDILVNEYFKPLDVYFEKELQPKAENFLLKKIKKQIKPFLPTFIKEKKVMYTDWNNYKTITEQMLFFLKNKNVKVHRTYNDYNDIITQWYVYISKNGFD